MRVTRCFVAAPLACGDTLLLPPGPSTHIARVLRLRAGSEIILFDGRGGEYEARILELRRAGVQVLVGTHRATERESPLAITLLQSLARAERMDWIVQKATELGVTAIVPVAAERSIVQLDATARTRKREHWQQVATSACEQCGRNRIPDIAEIATLERACAAAGVASSGDAAATRPFRLLLSPESEDGLAAAAQGARALQLLVGPEGGFSDRELGVASQFGFRPCRLGPRVLRTETAPLAALAALQALAGDLGA